MSWPGNGLGRSVAFPAWAPSSSCSRAGCCASSCMALGWQELVCVCNEAVSGSTMVDRHREGITSTRCLCCCGGCVSFFFPEWLFTLVSSASKMPACVGAPGTCRTEGFMVPNAKIPQAAKSLLQPSPGARKSCLLPAVQPGGGHRCQLCSPQPPANSSGKGLSSKSLPWNLPSVISSAMRTQNDSS